ncbi:MAG: sigma-70 family RNA polymerase sigma factor [Planctomycetes bacterium]|nr:sigma-70 family RNA polymerase sigma factor [Planctomycetota bacterium]
MPPTGDSGQAQPSDAELLAAISRGEDAAFATLYQRHREFVFRVAQRFARNEHDAADAAQTVFIDLISRAATLRLSGKLSTYLYPACKHAALAIRRKQQRREGANQVTLPAAANPSPTQSEALRRAVDSLADSQREVLLMRIVDGMSVEEVSLALAIPPGTVKSRLHAALQVLRTIGPD